jgi:sugar phosphate isomerase/epimerase
MKAGARRKDVGLQLYTVRDALSRDLAGTLRRVSRIGYNQIEAAGYSAGKFYGLKPGEFLRLCADLGLEIISSHAVFDAESQQQAIDSHAELGVKYMVYPVFPIDQDGMVPDFRRAADRLNRIGEACSAAGIRFGYHNHDFEFVDIEDTRGFDILLRSTESEFVTFQADIYWMCYAGVNPGDYFSQYPGRFELWHIKDMKPGPDKGFTEVGNGIIPYSGLLEKAGDFGMKHFFVEQDHCEIDPMKSIRVSYKNLYGLI